MNNDDPEKQEKIDTQEIEKALALLQEHFDTVQIFCTRDDDGNTTHVTMGSGNWFARFGHVIDWINWVTRKPPADSER